MLCSLPNIDVDKSVGESITEDNNTIHGMFVIGLKMISLHHCINVVKCDAPKIFQVHTADLCDITVDTNPHCMVNRFVSVDLLPQDIKEDAKNTTDVYNEADKIVEKLQRMIHDNEDPIELLKMTCDFLS